jgi:Tol biopolymer transport system component
MTNHARPDQFDSLMADWFDRDSQVRPPEQLITATLQRTARTRPLPAWRLPERWLPLATLAMRRPAVPRGAYVFLVVALLLVAVVAAIILTVGAHKAPPLIGPAGNGRIAYVAGGQLYSANPDGTNVQQLTHGPVLINAPAFSNDGTKLVYISTNMTSSDEAFLYGDLNVADADGTHVRALLTNARAVSNPAWSPDGRFIAISSAAEGALDHLNIVAVDGSSVVDLGDFGAGAWSPSWSQDGQRLAIIVGYGEAAHIDVVNRDGSNQARISQGSYKDIGEDGGAAMWSPDGKQLLFGGGDLSAYFAQFIVGLDGAKEYSIDPILGGDNGVWSPDGSQFAYLRPGDGSGPKVVIADRTGKELRVLPGEYSWHMPVWSPDGTRIAIADDRPGKFNLAGNPVTVILDAVGNAAPQIIPGVAGIEVAGAEIPSFSATWQRLAP